MSTCLERLQPRISIPEGAARLHPRGSRLAMLNPLPSSSSPTCPQSFPRQVLSPPIFALIRSNEHLMKGRLFFLCSTAANVNSTRYLFFSSIEKATEFGKQYDGNMFRGKVLALGYLPAEKEGFNNKQKKKEWWAERQAKRPRR